MTCGPSCTRGLPGRLTGGDGAAGADPGPLPPGDTPPRRVLVHPARPAPVATAPPRSKNSRRSMDTPRRLLTLGQPRRTQAAGNVRTRTGEGALSQSVVNW